MTSLHPMPDPCHWLHRLASALNPRSVPQTPAEWPPTGIRQPYQGLRSGRGTVNSRMEPSGPRLTSVCPSGEYDG